MTDDLGLGELTRDQLHDLGRAVVAEIVRRQDADLADAFRDAVAEIAAGARAAGDQAAGIAAAAARQARDEVVGWSEWSLARRAAMMIEETLGSDWTFCVWRSPDTRERRVYLDAERSGRTPGKVRAHHRPAEAQAGSRAGKVTYHVDGSAHRPPGTLECVGVEPSAHIVAIVRFLAACWDTRPACRVSIALAATVEPAPVPSYY